MRESIPALLDTLWESRSPVPAMTVLLSPSIVSSPYTHTHTLTHTYTHTHTHTHTHTQTERHTHTHITTCFLAVTAPVVNIYVDDPFRIYLYTTVTISCTITLVGVTVNDVDVNFSWMKDDSNFTGATGVTIIPTATGGTDVTIKPTAFVKVFVHSSIRFSSLQQANGGKYKCSTTFNRKGQPDTGISASGTENLVVLGKHFRAFHFK